jgi:hypothetical protein
MRFLSTACVIVVVCGCLACLGCANGDGRVDGVAYRRGQLIASDRAATSMRIDESAHRLASQSTDVRAKVEHVLKVREALDRQGLTEEVANQSDPDLAPLLEKLKSAEAAVEEASQAAERATTHLIGIIQH